MNGQDRHCSFGLSVSPRASPLPPLSSPSLVFLASRNLPSIYLPSPPSRRSAPLSPFHILKWPSQDDKHGILKAPAMLQVGILSCSTPRDPSTSTFTFCDSWLCDGGSCFRSWLSESLKTEKMSWDHMYWLRMGPVGRGESQVLLSSQKEACA